MRLAVLVDVPVGIMFMLGFPTGWDGLVVMAFMAFATWWSVGVGHERPVSHGRPRDTCLADGGPRPSRPMRRSCRSAAAMERLIEDEGRRDIRAASQVERTGK